ARAGERDSASSLPSARGSKGTPVVRLEDVAVIERATGPVEVYHYAANRVSQLFVSTADNDLAGVAADIRGIVRKFPLTYALDHLPANKKELAKDSAFRETLSTYLGTRAKKEREEQREAIRKEYDVEPN